MYKRSIFIAAIALVGGLSVPGDAADAPLPADDAASCELHVWPSTELKSVTEGVLWNDRVNQAFDPGSGGVARPAVLPPERQIALVQDVGVADRLGLAGAKTIFHPEPLSRAVASERILHTSSTASCYAELLVGQIIYQKNAMAGASLGTLGIFRRFDATVEPTKSFMTWTTQPLHLFPAAKAEDAQQANEEIEKAYRQTIVMFVDYAMNPVPAKRK